MKSTLNLPSTIGNEELAQTLNDFKSKVNLFVLLLNWSLFLLMKIPVLFAFGAGRMGVFGSERCVPIPVFILERGIQKWLLSCYITSHQSIYVCILSLFFLKLQWVTGCCVFVSLSNFQVSFQFLQAKQRFVK